MIEIFLLRVLIDRVFTGADPVIIAQTATSGMDAPSLIQTLGPSGVVVAFLAFGLRTIYGQYQRSITEQRDQWAKALEAAEARLKTERESWTVRLEKSEASRDEAIGKLLDLHKTLNDRSIPALERATEATLQVLQMTQRRDTP